MADKVEKATLLSEESPENEKTGKKCAESVLTQSKICGICGDKALGYNFNAISCESCKAFFRRNALLSKSFKCPFNEQCEITVVTRRFCQKCRLEKCFSIGMVKEYIMSEEDKAEKRKKIEQNRAKRQYPRSGDDTNVVTSSKTMKIEDSNDYIMYSQPSSVKINSPYSGEDSNATDDSALLNVQYNVLNSTTNSPTHNVNSLNNNISETNTPNTTYIEEPPSYPGVLRRNFVVNADNSTQHVLVDLNQSTNESYPSNQYSYPNYTVDFEDDRNELSGSHGVTMKSILTSVTNRDLEFVLGHSKKPVQCDISQEASPSTSSINMENKARDILEDVQSIPIEPNSIESILCEAIKLEFEAYSSVSQGKNSSRELNEVERAKLNELIVANKALHAPLDDDISVLAAGATALKGSHSKHDPTLVSIINLTAVAIRRLIKMAKKINAFKNMCEEDQVALLKGGCTEMMILRSTMTYDTARNTWKIPHSQEALSSIRADVLKLAKGDIYHEHERFIRTFEPRWRTDENIILIMSAIVLFTHHRPRVVHSDVIKLEQNSYYYLLRRYLESVYPGCEAKSTFLKLIQKIMELHKLADEVIGVYLDVNPIEPLLIEIFDLKHTTI